MTTRRLIALAVAALLPVQAHALGPERVIAIQPMGNVEQEYLDTVIEALGARVNASFRVEPARELPREAFYAPRKRYRAEILVDLIERNPPPGAWKTVIVTHAEISTTKGKIKDWGIAGLGNIGGRACVVSTHIYRKHSKTREVLMRRLADLSIHELGHTLGLEHCTSPGCVMRDAKGKALKSADTSTGHYCTWCRKGVSLGLLKPPLVTPAPETGG
jgi:archaemetzincin